MLIAHRLDTLSAHGDADCILWLYGPEVGM